MLLDIAVSGALLFGIGRLARNIVFRRNSPPTWALVVLTGLVFVCGVFVAQLVGPFVDEYKLERHGVESSSGAQTLTNVAVVAAMFFFLGLRRKKKPKDKPQGHVEEDSADRSDDGLVQQRINSASSGGNEINERTKEFHDTERARLSGQEIEAEMDKGANNESEAKVAVAERPGKQLVGCITVSVVIALMAFIPAVSVEYLKGTELYQSFLAGVATETLKPRAGDTSTTYINESGVFKIGGESFKFSPPDGISILTEINDEETLVIIRDSIPATNTLVVAGVIAPDRALMALGEEPTLERYVTIQAATGAEVNLSAIDVGDEAFESIAIQLRAEIPELIDRIEYVELNKGLLHVGKSGTKVNFGKDAKQVEFVPIDFDWDETKNLALMTGMAKISIEDLEYLNVNCVGTALVNKKLMWLGVSSVYRSTVDLDWAKSMVRFMLANIE